jgi:hypothetical protein
LFTEYKLQLQQQLLPKLREQQPKVVQFPRQERVNGPRHKRDLLRAEQQRSGKYIECVIEPADVLQGPESAKS